MESFIPEGLMSSSFDCLSRCVGEAEAAQLSAIVERAAQHVANAKQQAQSNALINVGLACAILDVMERTSREWQTVPAHAQTWLKGAFHYFSHPDNEEPDFESSVGFEDDVEIINACLKLAGRDDWCIDVEAYDDV